jgi:hypothetical protein
MYVYPFSFRSIHSLLPRAMMARLAFIPLLFPLSASPLSDHKTTTESARSRTAASRSSARTLTRCGSPTYALWSTSFTPTH